MRVFKFLIAVAFLFLYFVPSAFSSDREMVDRAVIPFLSALQGGNTKAMENLLGGDLKKQVNRLIKDNADYPKMLRNRFQGATLSFGDRISRSDGSLAIPLQIVFSDSSEASYLLVLRKDGDQRWKIVEEIRLLNQPTF